MLWCVDVTRRGDISEELDAPAATQAAATQPGGPPDPLAVRRRGMHNPNSGVVWKFATTNWSKPGTRNWNLPGAERMNRTMATVAIDPATGLLFVADFSGFMHCLSARTGRHMWTYEMDSPTWGSPLVCDGKVYQGCENGFVYVLEAAGRERLIGRHDMDTVVYSTPVYANGVLYIMTRDKLFAIAEPRPKARPLTVPSTIPATTSATKPFTGVP